MELDEREKKIIHFASDLLERGETLRSVPEARIDAWFLFRFDPVWCEWVGKIQRMMREIAGLAGDGPLSEEDGARVWVHLMQHPGVRVLHTDTEWRIETDEGPGYLCFDPYLQEKLNPRYGEGSVFSLEPEVRKQLTQQMLAEVRIVAKIQRELQRLAENFRLLPSNELAAREWTPAEMEEQSKDVTKWVIWGCSVPLFPSFWEGARLQENRVKGGLKRTIRPWRYPRQGHWREKEDGGRAWVEDPPLPPKRMTKAVRIRTWAIYYLTRRGGGSRTEEGAVEVWYHQLGSFVTVPNFRADRKRLFERGSKTV